MENEFNSGYQNVGSSGSNTANTASDYSDTASAAQPRQEQPGSQTGPSAPPPRSGYDYSSHYTAPQYEPAAPRRKGNAKKWLLRAAAAVAIVGVSFASGYAGAMVAGLNGPRIVTQVVEKGNPINTSVSGLSAVVEQVAPSVVVITTEEMVTSNAWFGGQYVQSGAGSGVILTEDGYIITCNHVVSGASSIKVTLSDDTEYAATFIGGDSRSDVAVIKIDASGLTPAVLGDSDTLAVGQPVFAVGNPLGELGGTVTDGIVSALNRDVTVGDSEMSLIQTNASVSPGNSGGALFNTAGELIGIVNAKSTGSYAEGLGFAIPINTAHAMATDLMTNGYITGRPALGISVIEINDAASAAQYGVNSAGVYIVAVNEGSGAQAAGLQVGDRIVSINDTLVEYTTDVTNTIADMQVGDVVTLQIAREGRLMTVEVTLGESAAPAARS